jgi:hypothetical protein
MVEQSQKPQTVKPILQRMRERKEQFYSAVNKAYDGTIMYIGKKPKESFWVGVGIVAFAFTIGYKAGDQSFDNKFTNMTRIVAGLDTKMISMEKKIDTVATDQTKIVNGINDMSMGTNKRIAELENEKNTKKAVEAGEKHVAEVKKNQSFFHKVGKILPWNW